MVVVVERLAKPVKPSPSEPLEQAITADKPTASAENRQ
jgi:hypothetical protein